jgi:hypothetical protein
MVTAELARFDHVMLANDSPSIFKTNMEGLLEDFFDANLT